MAKAKFNMSKMTALEQIQAVTDLKMGMTGNANFTTPAPTLTAGGTIIATAAAAVTAADAAQQAALLATANKDAALLVLSGLATQWVSYMQTTSGGDATKLISGGLGVQGASTPASIPAQVSNLSMTAGDNAGELDMQWDSQSDVNHFEEQLCALMDFSTGVIQLTGATKSKTAAFGLTSGSRMFGRVRAVNSAGAGAWSDVATKIVP